jgi:hypothetical protein
VRDLLPRKKGFTMKQAVWMRYRAAKWRQRIFRRESYSVWFAVKLTASILEQPLVKYLYLYLPHIQIKLPGLCRLCPDRRFAATAVRRRTVVNIVVKFNGWEYMFAYLRADVPFPIVGLDFLRFLGMQVNPYSPAILIAPSQRIQEGGTAGGGDLNAPHSCFSVRKEAQVPQLKAAAGARPIPPRIMKML